MIVPQTHDEHHALLHGGRHAGEAALLIEGVLVAERLLLGVAEGRSERVAGVVRDGGLRVGERLAVLNVEALDFRERAARSDELCDDGEFGIGVDGLAGAWGSVSGKL